MTDARLGDIGSVGHLRAQLENSLGVELARATLSHAQNLADLVEGETFVVVQGDNDLLAVATESARM